ncbi:MAG: delta-aminolevulinic acid dehydratase, partial [Nanoarchaeota archaeon]|nr:delta-aminolevulinic acid dehydratase [Nanoarchaeota archaeon]
RIYSYTKEKNLKELARKSVNYSIKAQNPEGSWVYGEMQHHQWIDNFHTGFNLCAINNYQKYTKDKRFNQNILLGLKYHLKNHFLNDMTPKYYNNKIYPIDIHNYAQGIITMLEFGKIKKAKQLANKATRTMQDEKGYFYYQKQKHLTNKIPYIRWSQAWMFYALSKLGENKK